MASSESSNQRKAEAQSLPFDPGDPPQPDDSRSSNKRKRQDSPRDESPQPSTPKQTKIDQGQSSHKRTMQDSSSDEPSQPKQLQEVYGTSSKKETSTSEEIIPQENSSLSSDSANTVQSTSESSCHMPQQPPSTAHPLVCRTISQDSAINYLWNKANPREQTLMCVQKEFSERIRENLCVLCKSLSLPSLFPILLQTKAVDEDKMEEIQNFATTKERVVTLMKHIQQGPTSRFHAFLRACALTNQDHIIHLVGQDPEDYGEAAAPSGMQSTRNQLVHYHQTFQQMPFHQPTANHQTNTNQMHIGLHQMLTNAYFQQTSFHNCVGLSYQQTPVGMQGPNLQPPMLVPAYSSPAQLSGSHQSTSQRQPSSYPSLGTLPQNIVNHLPQLPLMYDQPSSDTSQDQTSVQSHLKVASLGPHVQQQEQLGQPVQQQEQLGQPTQQQEHLVQFVQQQTQLGQPAQQQEQLGQPVPQQEHLGQSTQQQEHLGQSTQQQEQLDLSIQQHEQLSHPVLQQEQLGQSTQQQEQLDLSIQQHEQLSHPVLQQEQLGHSVQQQEQPGQQFKLTATNPKQPTTSAEMRHELPERLRKAITTHAERCKMNLMMRNIFDFKDDDRDEVINTAKCYIHLQVNISNHTITLELPEAAIFEKLHLADSGKGTAHKEDIEAPQNVRLYGPPGAGKTTFLRHMVHAWSIDFLQKEPQKWSTMVYIPARDITSTVNQAIEDHLWCDEKDVGILMTHVEEGEGVAIVIDAVDEIRIADVLKDLELYVRKRKTRGGPRVLISARNNLCSVNPQDFNRFLTLDGFTMEQGIEYMNQYFSLGQPLPIHQTALKYVARHKNKMEAMLCNPLKLHIFCALVEKNILELGEDFKLEILNLFEPLERYLTTREGGESVTREQSQNFYKLCLYALLSGIREFPKSILTQFKIVRNYHAFLVKRDERDKQAMLKSFYSFTHEMVFEYFASRHIESMSLESLRSLLLSVCSKKSLRNTQKIMFEIIQKKELHKEELMTLMIRCILILQQRGEVKQYCKDYINALLDLPNKIKSFVSIEQLVLSPQDADRIKESTKVLQEINDAFDIKCKYLRAVAWLDYLKMEGTTQHVFECLQICTPQEREWIQENTLNLLTQPRIRRETEHSVGSTRWGQVIRWSSSKVDVHAWSVDDMKEVIQSYTARHTDYQVAMVEMFISTDINQSSAPQPSYFTLWGEPEADSWSEEAWTSLLQAVPSTWGSQSIKIHVPGTVPLRGLSNCMQQTDLTHHGHTEVCVGGISVCGVSSTLYPAGSARWGQMRNERIGHVKFYTWNVNDMKEVIQSHTAHQTDCKVDNLEMFIYKGINSVQVDSWLEDTSGPPPLDYDLWGEPEADSWSEEAWTSLLQAVPSTWGSDGFKIHVPDTAPLRGLSMFLNQPCLSQHRHIEVYVCDIPLNIYPMGSARWGFCSLSGYYIAYAWSVDDMREVVQSFMSHYTCHADLQLTSLEMYISSHSRAPSHLDYDQWGEPEADSWSEEAWTSLLQALPNTWWSESFTIHVPDTVATRGLFACLQQTNLQQYKHIQVGVPVVSGILRSAGRWGYVETNLLSSVSFFAWSVVDMREVILSHVRDPAHGQGQKIVMYISKNIGQTSRPPLLDYDHWGEPEGDSWSEEAWTSLLQALPYTWGSQGFKIHVPDTVATRGLFSCLQQTHLQQYKHIQVSVQGVSGTLSSAGRGRWGYVKRNKPYSACLYAWSVVDMREVIPSCRDPAHQSVQEIVMYISTNISQTSGPLPLDYDLWGEPEADSWSEEAWTRLLQAVPSTWGIKSFEIHVPGTVPLTGLSTSLHQWMQEGQLISLHHLMLNRIEVYVGGKHVTL